MKKLNCAILMLLLLTGCKAKQSPTATTTPKASPTAASTPTPRATESPSAQSDDEQEYWTAMALYESCTVYAGATDYYFKTPDGETLQFRNSNLPDEEKAVKVSVELVDLEAGDGPPGANPIWVGRTFLLTLNSQDEVVAAEPVESEGELGESDPENARRSLEAAQAADSMPDGPVILAVPDGFDSDFFGGHEGTAVMINGLGGQVHIFIPNPEISTTGDDSVVGEGGLFESNGWSTMEVGRQTQPSVGWASSTFPFFGPDDLEGVVWLGDFRGTEVRVTASAPADQIDGFYQAIGPMVSNMQLRE